MLIRSRVNAIDESVSDKNMGVKMWNRKRVLTGLEPVIPDTFNPWASKDDPTGMQIRLEDVEDLDPISGQSFGIEYIDSQGEDSMRWITAYSFKGYPPKNLQAHCHLRGAPRAFKLENIESIYDTDGVVIEDVEGFFRQFSPTPTSGDSGHKMLDIGKDGALALVALSKCDGVMRYSEIEQIVGYLEELSLTKGYRPDQEEMDACFKHVRRMRPRNSTIDTSVKRLSRQSGEDKDLFWYRAKKLVEADNVFHEEEVTEMIQLREIIGG